MDENKMRIPRLRLRVAQCSLGMTFVVVAITIAYAQDQRPAKSATFHTTAGDFNCQLFPDEAPNAVANFAGLADGSKDWTDPETKQKMHGVPMYNGTIFHRVIPNFMIQGGDPLGTGSGDPGYSFKDEIVPSLTFDAPGKLAYANSGPDTNGSQFFITEVPTPHLNGHYVIFGQCDTAALHLVSETARQPRDERNDRPHEPVKIVSITIVR
jgi:peptidyl-prolyl cis-trans isomerase A (cyclophilin A)